MAKATPPAAPKPEPVQSSQQEVIRGGGLLGRPHPRTGERQPQAGNNYELNLAGSAETVLVENVADESEAIRLLKQKKGLGPKVTVRAVKV